ncbi:MAG: hypothetical protein H0S85_15135 [Desulfovibrionaceae bacterium]|nr:hypothetical protein [Desulfovibrionaceae bacterium]
MSYRKIRDATPTISIRYEGTLFPKEDIQVTANGVPIQNDVPAWTAFADQGITISILRKEDAFAAARAVCPALAPDKVIIDGHWE